VVVVKSEVVYPSRIDAWLVILTMLGLGAALVAVFFTWNHSRTEALIGLGTLVFMVSLLGLIGYPCTYTLAETELVVRSGVIRYRIPYSTITGIEPSRSPWSAPALSLRRVKISHGGRFMLVSPNEREEFIRELQQRVGAARA
jgi:membrane protein YdbS with pleckstrin-like domain